MCRPGLLDCNFDRGALHCSVPDTKPSVKEFVFFLALNNRTNLAAMTRVTGSFDGSGHVFNGSGALPNNTTQSSKQTTYSVT